MAPWTVSFNIPAFNVFLLTITLHESCEGPQTPRTYRGAQETANVPSVVPTTRILNLIFGPIDRQLSEGGQREY